MRYGSVCSGIEAATTAWHGMGWEPAFFSEIEAFPRSVLEHHYPDVPLHGDFTTITENQYGKIDLLVGGTPCQSFSVAGLRGGLDDERGNLALEFCRLAQRERPRWIVWENVPGVLSSSGGRDFGSILGALAELGYGLAYRVLDAQYFGVPQRRRRVFLVGYLGDHRPAAAVLFERQSLSRDTPPRREARESSTHDLAPCIGASGRGFERAGETRGQDPVVATGGRDGLDLDWPADAGDVSPTLRAMGHGASHANAGGQIAVAFQQNTRDEVRLMGGDGAIAGALAAQPGMKQQNYLAYTTEPPVAYSIMPMNSGKDYKARETDVAQPIMAGGPVGGNQGGDYILSVCPIDTQNMTEGHASGGLGFGAQGDPSFTLTKGHSHAVAYDMRGREGGAQFEGPHDTANIRAASGGSSKSYIAASAVRRLTPREFERLQGFPDDYTLVEHRKKPAADGPRYKALGNSMAVPVMQWIGKRIQLVDDLLSVL